MHSDSYGAQVLTKIWSCDFAALWSACTLLQSRCLGCSKAALLLPAQLLSITRKATLSSMM